MAIYSTQKKKITGAGFGRDSHTNGVVWFDQISRKRICNYLSFCPCRRDLLHRNQKLYPQTSFRPNCWHLLPQRPG